MPDLLLAPAPALSVSPLHLWRPAANGTSGDLVAEVAALVGLPLDPQQRLVADIATAYDVPGVPVCFELAVIVARQNLKTAVGQVLALTDLFVMGDKLHVWTAHLFDTAQKAFAGMVDLIDGVDELRALCRKPRMANGDQAIELLSGQAIEFYARGSKSGRGFTANKITADEGLFLTPPTIGAILPTMATVPGAQVRYLSSAGTAISAVLRSIRDRGRAGGDPSLGYVEWGATVVPCETDGCPHTVGTPGCALDREDLWRAANPALREGRITIDRIRAFRRAMDPVEFAREFLSWWEDPAGEVAGRFPADEWHLLAMPTGTITGPPSFALDVTPDARRAALCAAGTTERGLVQVEVIRADAGTHWCVERAREVTRNAGTDRIVVDPAGPASVLVPDLTAAGLDVRLVNLRELGTACGHLATLARTRGMQHLDQWELNGAVAGAATRDVGDGLWAWTRRSSLADIAPLVGVTLAVAQLEQTPPDIMESVW